MLAVARPARTRFRWARNTSTHEHTPKADTDDKTRVPMLGVRSKHVLPAVLECVCIGPNGQTGPHQTACYCVAQSRHTSSLGSHPAERPPRATLTSAPCTLPPVAPAANLCIEGSLSPMRMRSSTRDPTCAHIPRCDGCKRRLHKTLKPTFCILLAWDFRLARSRCTCGDRNWGQRGLVQERRARTFGEEKVSRASSSRRKAPPASLIISTDRRAATRRGASASCPESASRAQSTVRRTAARPAAAQGRHFCSVLKASVRSLFTLAGHVTRRAYGDVMVHR